MILNKINLKVNKGEIFRFLGPNGVGKSTTMKIICGLIKPDEGTVFINNKDIIKERILLYLSCAEAKKSRNSACCSVASEKMDVDVLH